MKQLRRKYKSATILFKISSFYRFLSEELRLSTHENINLSVLCGYKTRSLIFREEHRQWCWGTRWRADYLDHRERHNSRKEKNALWGTSPILLGWADEGPWGGGVMRHAREDKRGLCEVLMQKIGEKQSFWWSKCMLESDIPEDFKETGCLNAAALSYRKPASYGGAVVWGTALQIRRPRFRYPMVSFEFLIDIILQAALWPWGWLSL
jgi:hypothetical protein